MVGAASTPILRRMTTDSLERPAPLWPVLVTLVAVTLGAYVLLGALALAERAHGRWALGLLPVAGACFVLAGYEAVRFLRRSGE
jgi:hypothetical protein